MNHYTAIKFVSLAYALSLLACGGSPEGFPQEEPAPELGPQPPHTVMLPPPPPPPECRDGEIQCHGEGPGNTLLCVDGRWSASACDAACFYERCLGEGAGPMPYPPQWPEPYPPSGKPQVMHRYQP